MTKRIFFQRSESCRDLTTEEIGFILDVIWQHDNEWKIALVFGEAEWSIRLETQKCIDFYSNIHGTSVSFPLVTPKITLLSLEEWTDRPEPKSAFTSQVNFRKFLLLREYYKTFRIPNSLFRNSNEESFNNVLIKDAVNSDWMVKDYTSFSRTKSDYRRNRSIALLPPLNHVYRGK